MEKRDLRVCKILVLKCSSLLNKRSVKMGLIIGWWLMVPPVVSMVTSSVVVLPMVTVVVVTVSTQRRIRYIKTHAIN